MYWMLPRGSIHPITVVILDIKFPRPLNIEKFTPPLHQNLVSEAHGKKTLFATKSTTKFHGVGTSKFRSVGTSKLHVPFTLES
jgi:hypothetical protein